MLYAGVFGHKLRKINFIIYWFEDTFDFLIFCRHLTRFYVRLLPHPFVCWERLGISSTFEIEAYAKDAQPEFDSNVSRKESLVLIKKQKTWSMSRKTKRSNGKFLVQNGEKLAIAIEKWLTIGYRFSMLFWHKIIRKFVLAFSLKPARLRQQTILIGFWHAKYARASSALPIAPPPRNLIHFHPEIDVHCLTVIRNIWNYASLRSIGESSTDKDQINFQIVIN